MRLQLMQNSIFKIHVVFCFLDLSATLIFFFLKFLLVISKIYFLYIYSFWFCRYRVMSSSFNACSYVNWIDLFNVRVMCWHKNCMLGGCIPVFSYWFYLLCSEGSWRIVGGGVLEWEMAGIVGEEAGVGRSTEGISSGQRCQSGELLAEWRSSEQVENATPSTSPPYWDTDDDDDGGMCWFSI